MSNEARVRLLLEFADESAAFAHGFEAGRIWELAKTAAEGGLVGAAYYELIGLSFHSENAELVMRMGDTLGLTFHAEQLTLEQDAVPSLMVITEIELA